MPSAVATTARRPLQKAVAVLRWLYLHGADIMAYGLLAAGWAVGVRTASPSPRRLKQEAVAALRWIYFLAMDMVVYGFLAVLWVGAVGAVVPLILGRWVCGEGSAVSEASGAVLMACRFIIVRFLPGFMTQFFAIRMMDHVRFEAKQKREKLATSSSAIMVPSAQRQGPERKGVQRLLPMLSIGTTLSQLMLLGLRMKTYCEEGSVAWRIGYVLFDVTVLSCAFTTAFVLVPNMVIVAVRFPGRRIGIL